MKFRAALRAPRGGPLRQHSCRKEGRYRLREASPTRYGTEYRGGFGRPRREPERPEPRAPRSGRGEGWPGASAKRETEGATKETAPCRRNPKGRSTFVVPKLSRVPGEVGLRGRKVILKRALYDQFCAPQ